MQKNNGTTGFFSCLALEKIDEPGTIGRANWRLAGPLLFMSEHIGFVLIDEGFETDLASVPRLPLAWWLAGDTAHASAVVHDYLCRVLYPACRIDWLLAARVFLEAMEHEGVPWWRRKMMYWGVRLGNPRRSCARAHG